MWPLLRNACLLLAIDAGGDVAQRVLVGIDKAMAGSDIARRTDAHQAQAGAAGMRLVDALVEFGDRVADVRESVHLAAQRVLEVLLGQHMELAQNTVHAAFADGIEPIRRSRHRREADLVESELVLQVAVDSHDVRDAGGQRNARRDRARAVARDQRFHARCDDVVAAAAVGEDAQLVVQLRRAVHADRDADIVVREELDDRGRQQRGVGGEAEIDASAALFRLRGRA